MSLQLAMSPPRVFGMLNEQTLFLKQMYRHEDREGLAKVAPGLPLPKDNYSCRRVQAQGASSCSVPFGSLSVTAK